jgi:hypothetical protein
VSVRSIYLQSRAAFLSLLGLNFILKALVAIRPLKYIDGLTIPDDAYLSLTLARNIAKGLGPHYGFDYTNGFQPLYVFLVAPVYWFFPHDLITPVHVALFLLAIFDTATLYLLYRLARLESKAAITPIIVALVWVFNPYTIRAANNGMETSISLFFIMAAYFQFRQMRLNANSSYKSLFTFGVILGLAMLARIDNAILSIIFCGYLFWVWRKSVSPLSTLRNAGVVLGGITVVCLPWIIYLLYYVGDLIPVSGQAVRYMSLARVYHSPTLTNWYLISLKDALAAVARLNLAPIAVIISLLLISILSKEAPSSKIIIEKFKKHNSFLLFSIILFCAYAFYVFGLSYFNRYLYPLILLPIIYMMTMIDTLNLHLVQNKSKHILNLALIVFIVASAALRPSVQALYFSKETQLVGYMNLGIWARDNIPNGTTVGSSQTGALGYFAQNLNVINLDGVVNRRCFEALKEKRNIEYIRQMKIEYIIGWQENIDFIRRESASFKPDDLEYIRSIVGFKSWWDDWYLYRVNYKR